SGGSNTRRGLADKENLDSDNAPTWSQKWTSAVLPDNFPTGDSVVANGLLYYAVDDTVRGYSLTTGSSTDRAPTYTAVTDFTDVSQTTRARLQSAPTVDGNRLYVVASDGVYAFDATTGVKVWKASVNTYQSVPAPIVVGSRVIASDDTGVLRSFATSNGSPGWLLDLPETHFWVGQMASDGTSLFGMQCTTAYAINATTGVLTWSRVMPGTEDYGGCFPFGVVTTPLVHDGLVYFGSYSTAALRTSDGTVAWSRKYASGGAMALSHGVLVLTELVPYAFGWSPQLRAVDPQSGAQRWVNNTDFPAGSPAVTVVDDLVLTNGSAAALGLDIQTGERLWASDQVNGNFTAGTQVIPVGERIYFVGADKRIHAYGG
nr:PQQ-binding-like beta-propeller repeat protein [Candidatus Nanopelagicales bacterium]